MFAMYIATFTVLFVSSVRVLGPTAKPIVLKPSGSGLPSESDVGGPDIDDGP
jgi:hypothetical protein